MSRNRTWCNKCNTWTMHEFEYERNWSNGVFQLTITITCIHCGEQVVETR